MQTASAVLRRKKEKTLFEDVSLIKKVHFNKSTLNPAGKQIS